MDAVNTRVPVLFLYDGHCGFCNASVQWLLKRDKSDVFRFAPQQSPLAEAILLRHQIDRKTMLTDNSVYLVLDLNSAHERVLTRSEVGVEALCLLGGGWGILGRLLQAVPKFARDGAYTLIARHRYRLARRYEFCRIPSAAEREKFLS